MSASDHRVQAVLDLLTRAAHDKNAGALRWPILASASPDRGADARMLVLRRFERDALILELHTDARAPKIDQLRAESRCALVFFDTRTKVQLRVFGEAAIHDTGSIAEAAFERVQKASLDEYRGAPPGALLASEPDRSDDARANFAVIRIKLLKADWLKLSRSGHERFVVDYTDPSPNAQAIEP